jgi:SAM-dependent methyltransferase
MKALEADGEALDDLAEGAFGAVISRLGLIYFPDQHRALAGMRRVLREGGRIAAIVYSTAYRNQLFSIRVSIVRDRLSTSSAPDVTIVIATGGSALGCLKPRDRERPGRAF